MTTSRGVLEPDPVYVGAIDGERVVNWAQLQPYYRQVAMRLHRMALNREAIDHNDIGPIYVRQALALQRERTVLISL